MARIISDGYFINRVPNFNGISENAQKFDQRIKAVHSMYKFLDENNILKEISFAYDGDDTGSTFAFETEKLEKYKTLMLESGVENADIAVDYIFNQPIKPCEFCGGIKLIWTMTAYRDNGNAYKTCECSTCRHLDNKSVHEIRSVKDSLGERAAIEHMWTKVLNHKLA